MLHTWHPGLAICSELPASRARVWAWREHFFREEHLPDFSQEQRSILNAYDGFTLGSVRLQQSRYCPEPGGQTARVGARLAPQHLWE
uniref:Uncharacterized protein n=1 Tax=Rangifer tarandus platyrhynchus TaxID=3082113 RepID=A0ACB0EU41_RANTA|nr:unnamed protein product [Rangifer tarandus platyrhynchus]